MPEFLTSNHLNNELEFIIEDARKSIILISPFIKLHERYISALKTKREDPWLEIILVFGKNKSDYSKSMRQEDFDFFKEFPNIEIRYEKRLHAKYYANERRGILTSMNLYDRSQDYNIEAGILIPDRKSGLLRNMANMVLGKFSGERFFKNQVSIYFDRVVEQSDLLFKREPQFDGKLFGIVQKYIASEVKIDVLSDFFISQKNFRPEINNGALNVHSGVNNEVLQGYCIRTGIPIPFNLNKPMCEKSLSNWNQFRNKNYPEKYCHFSGEPSLGKTTYANPVLEKYLNKVHNNVA